MEIKKVIRSQIEQDYFFIKGNLNKLDSKYFTTKIDEGVKLNSNLNYKTNVKGKQTSFDFFCNDKNFEKTLYELIDYLDDNGIATHRYRLVDAWGVKEGLGDFSKKHHHLPCYVSGIVYLNDHPQTLYFPEIGEEITPKRGEFVLFSSFLYHYNKRSNIDKYKYAISFNFEYLTIMQ
tara:strand:+ start:111 stop:641 length:531 start_codon:yes stop_codon:yes gene_type:complete